MRSLIFVFIVFPFLVFSNTGIIEGRVYDEINNEAIIGANVILKGTTIGASTDIEGNYKIEGLTAGL